MGSQASTAQESNDERAIRELVDNGNFQEMKDVKIEGTSDIQEIKVLGDWAWMRNFLKVTFTPPKGSATVHSGYILTILRKIQTGTGLLRVTQIC